MSRSTRPNKRERRLYPIRYVARETGLHPQTLRLYERAGLLRPLRSEGNTRLYSRRDMEQLRRILALTREHRVNLAGVSLILDLEGRIEQLERRLRDHERSESSPTGG